MEATKRRHGSPAVRREPALLYPLDEAAELLSVSRSQVYNLIRGGDLESVHIGKRRLIPRVELESYVEGLQATPQIGGDQEEARLGASTSGRASQSPMQNERK
jgi:excisionase family DNA binding protein